MHAISLPSRPLRSNKGISLLVPRVKTKTDLLAFHSCAPLNNLPLSVRSAISKCISLTRPFIHRPQHTWWPTDVTQPLYRFCCWTLILLLRHWAWQHCRGYWHYRYFVLYFYWLISPGKLFLSYCLIPVDKLTPCLVHVHGANLICLWKVSQF